MTEKQHGGYWFAMILITVGVVLLMQNFGVVSPMIWSELFRFWPVLIIIAGLEIILGKSFFGQLLLVLITFVILFFVLTAIGFLPPNLLQGINLR